jgi:hypothetical protein
VPIVSNNQPQSNADEPKRGTRRDRRPAKPEPRESEVMREAAAIYPDTFDTPPTPDEIAAEAYAIYLSRGGEHGRHEEDWLEAERRLTQRRTSREQSRDPLS